jgi:hypothetical protein
VKPSVEWRSIQQTPAPDYKVVLLCRAGDLYPVLGWRLDDGSYYLEEGGAEDDERRQYPRLWWEPEFWADPPDTP